MNGQDRFSPDAGRKKRESREIRRQVAAFRKKGGKIAEIPFGVSGQTAKRKPLGGKPTVESRRKQEAAAVEMLARGETVDRVARVTGLPVGDVTRLTGSLR